MKIIKFMSIFLLLITYGCDQSNDPDELTPDPSIVFGESIARVRIGDDSSTVVRKLGRPSAILDGDFKGYIFYYTEGILAYTFVSVSQDPALGLGVMNISVEGPYTGKSKERIGISSERNFVIERLGPPDTTIGERPVYDFYFYEKNNFGLTYDQGHIVRINMGKPKHK